jgi:hypothetical protein
MWTVEAGVENLSERSERLHMHRGQQIRGIGGWWVEVVVGECGE